jgi:hypothetical protein
VAAVVATTRVPAHPLHDRKARAPMASAAAGRRHA